MQIDGLEEAKRQLEICNACRYCEGYCAVFPAVHAQRDFANGDLTQWANLCHNCRGSYYACQYTAPYEFDLNLPAALATVRNASWQQYALPAGLGQMFQTRGVFVAGVMIIAVALMFSAALLLGNEGGQGFYAVLSHSAMVAIFAPAFFFPFISLTISLRRYWRDVGGRKITIGHLRHAFAAAAGMKTFRAVMGKAAILNSKINLPMRANMRIIWLCMGFYCALLLPVLQPFCITGLICLRPMGCFHCPKFSTFRAAR